MIKATDIVLAWIGMLPGTYVGDTAEGAIESAYTSIPAVHIGLPQFMTLDEFAANLKRTGHVPRYHINNHKLSLPESGFGVHHSIPRNDIVKSTGQAGRWWVRQSQTDLNVAEPERFLNKQADRLDVRAGDVLHAVAALGWSKAAVENLAPEDSVLLFEQAQ